MNKCIYRGSRHTLHGIYQKSYIIGESYAIGGHKGGQIAFPIAVVESSNGSLIEVPIQDIKIVKKENINNE